MEKLTALFGLTTILVGIGIVLFAVIIFCVMNKVTRNEQDLIILEDLLSQPKSEANRTKCEGIISDLQVEGMDGNNYVRFEKACKRFINKYQRS